MQARDEELNPLRLKGFSVAEDRIHHFLLPVICFPIELSVDVAVELVPTVVSQRPKSSGSEAASGVAVASG